MPFIDPAPTDAPHFLTSAETIIELALRAKPAKMRVIRIDNWFGSRWVAFAGKIVGKAGVRFPDLLVVPPFVPSRVVADRCYAAPDYTEIACAEPLHITQHPEDNSRRDAKSLLPQTLAVWFSSNSETNGRGSIMAYVPGPAGHEAWFADLAAPSWKPRELIGLTQHSWRV